MTKRRLGNSELEVPPFVFGGNVFGWTADEAMSFTLLDALVESGFNFIDTADVYSRWAPGNQGGESEAIIGRWLERRGNRDKVIIATKVGKEMGPGREGLSKAYILRAVEDSLRRLQTDTIDLYQSHADDADTPMEETLEAYSQLIGEGKVRVIGASNFGAERLSLALRVSREQGYPRYQSLQPLYNLYDRAEYETQYEDLCLKEGLGVITYFSLASGFLTGKYRSRDDLSHRARSGFVEKYLNERGLRILEALDTVAGGLGSTPARVSIAWMLTRPGITAPIASATSLEQLNDLIEGTRLVLDPTAIELLDQASSY